MLVWASCVFIEVSDCHSVLPHLRERLVSAHSGLWGPGSVSLNPLNTL